MAVASSSLLRAFYYAALFSTSVGHFLGALSCSNKGCAHTGCFVALSVPTARDTLPRRGISRKAGCGCCRVLGRRGSQQFLLPYSCNAIQLQDRLGLQMLSQNRMQSLGYEEASVFSLHRSPAKMRRGKKATQTPETHMPRLLKGANVVFMDRIREAFVCLLSF